MAQSSARSLPTTPALAPLPAPLLPEVPAVATTSTSKRQAAAQQQQALGSQQAAYGKARAACLEGRGYTVK